jgi:DNA gyrase/topoisomerase IV subunit A
VVIGVAILSLAIVLLAGCGVSKSEYEALQAELDGVQSDLTDLQADYEAVSNELSEIKEVYPPREFSSPSELKDWLLSNEASKRPVEKTAEALIGRALEVQKEALADGYIVSVMETGTLPELCGGSSAAFSTKSPQNCYFVVCMTIINGYIWIWPVGTNEPIQASALGEVE